MRQAEGGSAQHTPQAIPPIVHEVLRSPGQPLDSETRAFMEPRLGHDFSQVRVHHDKAAMASAQAVNALAYTVGRDIVFAPGHYAPGNTQGQRLLAHELTHVVQQVATSQASPARRTTISRKPRPTPPDLTQAAESFSRLGIAFGSVDIQTGNDIRLNPAFWSVVYTFKHGNDERIFTGSATKTGGQAAREFLVQNPEWAKGPTEYTVRVSIGRRGAAAALDDLWNPLSMPMYSLECYLATALMELRGIHQRYRARGQVAQFNQKYNSFAINLSQGLPTISLAGGALLNVAAKECSLAAFYTNPAMWKQAYRRGDWVYIVNPFLAGAWAGENAVYLGNRNFWGHPIRVFNLRGYAYYLLRKGIVRNFARRGVKLPTTIEDILLQSRIKLQYRPDPTAQRELPTEGEGETRYASAEGSAETESSAA